ncbi:MAG: DUF5667 domain-containing protein, partial [Candidatus Methanoperedens sp.]|nr:DUF5667 domain-containing protein [Candidatus Methanoperedens sp.]
FNDSEKVGKQVSQARHRLAEIKAALKNNNNKAAESAIDQYQEETEQAEESISRIKKDKGLINAQSKIAKNEYVLEGLIESHPNNSGLIRAHNNSEILLNKFASKTSIKLERMTDKMGRKVLKHVEIEDDADELEKTSVKAQVEDNKTHVKVELKFLTNSTTSDDIAGDILERVNAIGSDVSGLIKIEREGEKEDEIKDEDEVEDVTGEATRTLTASTAKILREKIKAQAEVGGNTTRVEFEYQFFLNTTEDNAIIDGVKEKLSAMTKENILSVLGVDVKEIKETSGRKIEDTPKVETTDGKLDDNRGQPEKRNSRADDN